MQSIMFIKMLCDGLSVLVCVFVLHEFTFVWFYEVWDLVIYDKSEVQQFIKICINNLSM